MSVSRALCRSLFNKDLDQSFQMANLGQNRPEKQYQARATYEYRRKVFDIQITKIFFLFLNIHPTKLNARKMSG